jgi:hypothetical protein
MRHDGHRSRNPVADRRRRLVRVLKRLAAQHAGKLDELKGEARQLERADFLWHFLLQSFATMGNSRGWAGLMADRGRYERVTYQALATVAPSSRARLIEEVFREAKVRMPAKKAGWLTTNFERIAAMGGPAAARANLLRGDRVAIIQFLKRFDGIGDKYARNIMMDVYHPAFRDSVAIDERIKKVSTAVGVSFRTYAEHERFYVDVARDARLEPWEVDRLLYWYTDAVLDALAT